MSQWHQCMQARQIAPVCAFLTTVRLYHLALTLSKALSSPGGSSILCRYDLKSLLPSKSNFLRQQPSDTRANTTVWGLPPAGRGRSVPSPASMLYIRVHRSECKRLVIGDLPTNGGKDDFVTPGHSHVLYHTQVHDGQRNQSSPKGLQPFISAHTAVRCHQ